MTMTTQMPVMGEYFRLSSLALPPSQLASEGHLLATGERWAEPLEPEPDLCSPESYPSDLTDRTIWAMNRSQSVAEVLSAELDFIERGGYRHFVRCSTEESPVFRMSPSCANFGHTEQIWPCSACALWALVPQTARAEKLPCHFIPLDDKGTTVHDLAPLGEAGVERSVAQWVRRKLRESKQQGG